jgi:tRNA threonylcarbamoyladenosine biosynthesis protein TsaE
LTITRLSLDLADEAATHALARRLAASARAGDVIALGGELGAGKTSLARAFIRAALDDDAADVPSPTFTLVQTYPGPEFVVWHVDAYRLKTPDEIWELGIEEAFADGVLLIEWRDRLGPLLPARRLDLTLTPGPADHTRTATLEDRGGADWITRLAAGRAP